MRIRPQNERILFGLKLRQLRQQRDLSFQQLATLTGMSVSYLNEIEKGKKSPKSEKLNELARALEVDVQELLHPTLEASLKPVASLLKSNFLNELPLDRFGIELSKIVEIIANAPARVGAFISSLLELSRNYALLDENFYIGALRSWLEMHENYLEDAEAFAKTLRKSLGWKANYVPTTADLIDALRKRHDYRILPRGLDDYPTFAGLESVFIPTDRTLLLSSSLQTRDLRHKYAIELGFQEMDLAERSLESPILQVKSFDMALSQASAIAFAGALLLPTHQIDAELKMFFGEEELPLDIYQTFLRKYEVTPTVFFDRVAALLPRFKHVRSLYFIELTEHEPGIVQVTKELHLGRQHHPHATSLLENYCRRWVGTRLLLKARDAVHTGVQVSRYHAHEEAYITVALADKHHDGKRRSVFIGTPLTPELESRIPSLLRDDIPRKVVGNTCERCPIADCAERVAPATVEHSRQHRRDVADTIAELQRKARQAARRARI